MAAESAEKTDIKESKRTKTPVKDDKTLNELPSKRVKK
jgi:hypothetical protein